MIEKPLAKLRARHALTVEEEQTFRDAIGEIQTLPADCTFIREAQPLAYSTLLLDGLMVRYKDLSGGLRQITHIHVAGDFADLHSFTLKHLDHSMMTLTPCRIAKVPHERLTAITERLPRLTRIFWFDTNLDAAIHREWVLSLGRRNAIERAAHLFCELRIRLAIVGLSDAHGYAFPLTQVQLAECLGLTSVHVNRVLRELRERGLVELRSGRVRIHDLAGLEALCEFDPAYLYLRPPRLD